MDCQSKGGKLFEPRNKEINDAIAALMTSRFYVGITDITSEGTFCYLSDNQDITYDKWSTDEPNNAFGTEDCVHVKTVTYNYEWNDITCTHSYVYVCEGLLYNNP